MGDDGDMYSATHRPGNHSPSRRNGAVSGRYQGPKAYEEAFAEIAAKPPIFQKAVTKRPRLQDLRPTLRLARQGAYSREASRVGIRAYGARLGQSDGPAAAT
ncbi:hypothetical protein DPSP01_001882 [Paraphaeosphaeria sporulosa]